jgi:hypothetical protein
MGKLTVILNPTDRQAYIDDLLHKDGLSHLTEDPTAAYCPISLTQTPDEIKPFVLQRQQILMDQVLARAGITAYDPSTAPFSPDKNLHSLPQEVYLVDSGKIASARFFVGHNLTASTGFGVELEKAIKFNRMAVILLDRHIRVSRMMPHRVIYLQYHHFAQQVEEFVQVFKILSAYQPGMGFAGPEPVLLGFKQGSDQAVNLEKLIYTEFPTLQYQYDGQQPSLNLSATNPEVFVESQQ